jgi:heat shock protein HtpX
MNEQEWAKRKLWNVFQSLLAVVSMAMLLGFVGWIVGGEILAFLVLGIIISFFIIKPSLSPCFILRMYQAKPLSYDEVSQIYDLIQMLAERAGLKSAPTLYLIPGNVMQAVSVGDTNDSGIAVSQSLLKGLSLRELAGVLAHEIGHIQSCDTKLLWFANIFSSVTGMLSWIGIGILLANLPFILLGVFDTSLLPVLSLVFAPLVSHLLFFNLSRIREYDADLGAVELTGDPEGLALALAKIENKKYQTVKRFFFPKYKISEPALLLTHPPTEERVRRLLEIRKD